MYCLGKKAKWNACHDSVVLMELGAVEINIILTLSKQHLYMEKQEIRNKGLVFPATEVV